MTVTEIIPNKYDIINGYIEREQHLSYSAIKAFMKSPRHFIQYKTRKVEPTPAMEFGTAFHMAVLEPEKFKDHYYIVPEDAPRRPSSRQINAKNPSEKTLESIAWWENFLAENEGKEELSYNDHQTILHMQESVFSNGPARWVLDQITEFELPQKWEYGGFKWRGFLDGRGDGVILDLKTISDAHPDKCYREMVYKMFYHVQGFLYRIPNPDHDYYIIFVDKTGHVTTVNLKETTLLAAKEKLDHTLRAFKKCLFLNQWDKSYDFYAPREGAGIYSF